MGADPTNGHTDSASLAVARSLRGAALVWVGVWLALIGLGMASDVGTPVWSWLLLGTAVASWVAALLAGQRALHTLVVVLVATAWLQAIASAPETVVTHTEPVLAWTILAAVAIGLCVDRARGAVATAVAIAAVGGGSLLAVVAASTDMWGRTWPQVAAVTVFALADGMAAATGAASLRQAGAASDTAAQALSLALTMEATEREQRQSARRVGRVLHDTVVNTLGLVRRGVDATMIPILQMRCRADLQAIERLWARGPAPSAVACEGLAARLRARTKPLGLTVHEDVDIRSGEPVPGPVAEAVITAGGEALLNAAKHSGVTSVRLWLRWTGDTLDVAIEDQGKGWPGTLTDHRGVQASIHQPSAAAGIAATVTSVPGAGTSVRLRWPDALRVSSESELPLLGWSRSGDQAMARAAAGLGSWLSGLCLVLTLLTWSVVPSAGSVMALLVLAATLIAAWTAASWAGALPIAWWTAAGLVAAAGAVVVLPANGATTCDQLALAWWGPEAGLVVLIVVAAVTRRPGWVVAATVIYVVAVLAFPLGGDLPIDCATLPVRVLALDLSIFVVALVFRRVMLKLWQAASDALRSAHERDVESAKVAAASNVADAQIDRVLAQAVPLLNGLASGRFDVDDDSVRRHCGDTEEALRALILLGSATGTLATALAAGVAAAHSRGQRLTITSPPPAGLECPTGVPALLSAALSSLPTGGSITAAVLRDDAGVLMALTCTPRLPAMQGCNLSGNPGKAEDDEGVSVHTVHLGSQSYTEIRWTK